VEGVIASVTRDDMRSVDQVGGRSEVGTPKRRLSLGRVLSTPAALDAMEQAGVSPTLYLRRHATGDWGELSEEDRQENELSVEQGFRVMSVYRLPSDVKMYVITEADRSATTFLLPADY